MVANIPHHHEEVIAVSMGVPDLEEFEYIRKSERRIQTNIEKELYYVPTDEVPLRTIC
jgi:hypothetical protein